MLPCRTPEPWHLYVNLAGCVVAFLLVYALLPRLSIAGIQEWVGDGRGGAHTEGYAPKDPLLVLCDLAWCILLYVTNSQALRILAARRPPEPGPRGP